MIPDGIESIDFKFDSAIKNNSDITVQSYRYNRDNGTFTIYVSGTADDILKKGYRVESWNDCGNRGQ